VSHNAQRGSPTPPPREGRGGSRGGRGFCLLGFDGSVLDYPAASPSPVVNGARLEAGISNVPGT
jgi:hypothetical protein